MKQNEDFETVKIWIENATVEQQAEILALLNNEHRKHHMRFCTCKLCMGIQTIKETS